MDHTLHHISEFMPVQIKFYPSKRRVAG